MDDVKYKRVLECEFAGQKISLITIEEECVADLGYPQYMVVNTLTTKAIPCISFEHARSIYQACINNIIYPKA